MKKIIFLVLFTVVGWQQLQAQCPGTSIAFTWGGGTTYTYAYDGVRNGKCAFKQLTPGTTIEWTGSQWNIYGNNQYSGSVFFHSTVNLGDRPSNNLVDWVSDFNLVMISLSGTGTIDHSSLVEPTASAQTFCNSATVADLVAIGVSGSTFNWYDAAVGGSALISSTVLSTGTYYVSQTLNGLESARTSAEITVNTTPAPTASAQTFCSGATVANLAATGTNLNWYAASTDGSALATTTELATGTYYVSQTLNNCESTRTSVAVTVNTTPAPTASVQTFCSGATVANLVASPGVLGRLTPAPPFKWYAASSGGSALATSTALATGTYYVSYTLNNCESPRTSVAVTVNTTPAPTASAAQTFCGGATIASLVATGTNIKWYINQTGGSALATTNPLVNNRPFYGSQTLNGCESARIFVVVTLRTTPTPTASAQNFCSGATVSNLVASGVSLKWYAASTGGSALTTTTALATGTYYVSQTSNNGCESNRTVVAVTVNTPQPPTASAQTFCSGATVSSLAATGTSLNWYNVITGGSALATTTALATGTYYVSQTSNGCEGARTPVAVTIRSNVGALGGILGIDNIASSTTTATYSVAPATGATSYIWNFPAGITLVSQTGTSVTVAFSSNFTSGIIKVKAVGQCSDSQTQVKSIKKEVPTPLTITGSKVLCSNTSQTYTVNEIAGANYVWSVPANVTLISGQGTNSIVVNAANGFASGNLAVTCNSNTDSTSATLAIAGAIAPTAITGFTNLCGLTQVGYSTTLNPDVTYQWTVPDGMNILNGANTNSILVQINGGSISGAVTVKSVSSCGVSAPVSIIVGNAVLGAIRGDNTVCGATQATIGTAGQIINNNATNQYTYSVSAVTGFTNYTWAVPTGATIVSGQGTNTVIVAYDLTTFDSGVISVQGTNSCGLGTSSQLAVSSVRGKISGPKILCAISSAIYSVPAEIGSNFVWSLPPGMTITSGAGTASINVAINHPVNFSVSNVVSVVITTPCGGQKTLYLNIGCSEYTSIQGTQCGANVYYNTKVFASPIAGVDGYAFDIYDATGTNLITTLENSENYFRFTQFNFTFQTTYVVKVRVKHGTTYNTAGAACSVGTLFPTSHVLTDFCGITLAGLDTKICAAPIVGATDYRFEITAGGVTTVYDAGIYNFRLTDAGIATYNTTYSIRVAIKVNNVYGPYGTACSISTPALTANSVPTTQLLSAFCNTTLASLNTKIGAYPVYNANAYRFKIVKAGVETIYVSNVYNFRLSDAGIVPAYGMTYTISVAARVNGTFGNYGASCEVTTPSGAVTSRQIVDNTDFSLVAYPNPSNSVFKLQINSESDEVVSILVFDMTGRQIENKVVIAADVENIALGQNYASGVYNVIVSQGMNTKTVRLVKK